MGLAWDALWNAIISPQQDKDKKRRATEQIMETLADEDGIGPFLEHVRKEVQQR